MKKTRALKIAANLGSAVLISFALSAISGCEPSADEDYSGADAYFEANPYSGGERDELTAAGLEIHPTLKKMSIVGEVAVFEGRGGAGPYTWSVSDSHYGYIDVIGWSEAVYTCTRVGNNNVIVRDSKGHSAVASIRPAEDVLTVTPASVILLEDEYYAAFSVSGGTPPYSWSVGNPELGTIAYSADTSHTAGYTAVAGAFGVNVVTAKDAAGQTASATVTRTTEDD